MNKSTKKSLGIIGFGQFAQFFISYLKPHFSEVVVSSRRDKSKISQKLGVKFDRAEIVAEKDIVMLAMPISEIENVLKKIRNFVKRGTIVMDVCSVKVYPIKMMKKLLPRNVEILGTHPLFGPQSGKNGIKNFQIVFCPARIKKKNLHQIKNIFQKMGLKLIFTDAASHDKIMAYSQALTHFFAKAALPIVSFKHFPFSTPSARKLFSILADVKDDSEQLFKDIETLNPYAKKMRRELLKNLSRINSNLN